MPNLKVRHKLRIDTLSNLNTANPILLNGEPCLATYSTDSQDTVLGMVIGDGTTNFVALWASRQLSNSDLLQFIKNVQNYNELNATGASSFAFEWQESQYSKYLYQGTYWPSTGLLLGTRTPTAYDIEGHGGDETQNPKMFYMYVTKGLQVPLSQDTVKQFLTDSATYKNRILTKDDTELDLGFRVDKDASSLILTFFADSAIGENLWAEMATGRYEVWIRRYKTSSYYNSVRTRNKTGFHKVQKKSSNSSTSAPYVDALKWVPNGEYLNIPIKTILNRLINFYSPVLGRNIGAADVVRGTHYIPGSTLMTAVDVSMVGKGQGRTQNVYSGTTLTLTQIPVSVYFDIALYRVKDKNGKGYTRDVLLHTSKVFKANFTAVGNSQGRMFTHLKRITESGSKYETSKQLLP